MANIVDVNRIAAEGFRAESQDMITEVVDKVKAHKAKLEEIVKSVDGVAKRVDARRGVRGGCRGLCP